MSEPTLNTHAVHFRYPGRFRALMIGCLIILCGFLVFGLTLPISDSRPFAWYVAGASTIVFGFFTYLVGNLVLHLWDSVALDKNGVWSIPLRGQPRFLRWEEIASVEAREVGQRLVLSDASGLRKIKLEYQLDKFEQLRNIVLQRTAHARMRMPQQSIFHTNHMNRGFYLFGFLLFAGLALFLLPHGDPVGAPIMIFGWPITFMAFGRPIGPYWPNAAFVAFAVLSLFALAREWSKVTISLDSMRIDYLGWHRTLPFSSVTNIRIANVASQYSAVFATVVVERGSKRPLKFYRVREGSVTMCDNLRRAWLAHGYGSSTQLNQ